MPDGQIVLGQMDLAPSAPSLNTVLAGLPLSISEELDARAVEKQVQRPVCTALLLIVTAN